MKWILLTIFLLVSCSNKVVNPHNAYVLVTQDGRVVSNKEYLHGREGTFTFSFVESGATGLTPVIYMNGDIRVAIDILDPERPNIKPNVTYQFKYRFRTLGRATIMLIWESKNHFGTPFLLNLEY